jgi:hypothetical protein
MFQKDNKTYLTPADVYNFYDCDQSTIRHARIKGNLEYIKVAANKYYYELSSVELYFGKPFVDLREIEMKERCCELGCIYKGNEVIKGLVYVTYVCPCGKEVRKGYACKFDITKSCRECQGRNLRKPIDSKGHKILNVIYNKNGNNKIICEMICKICGNIFSTEPRHLGDYCNKCYKRITDEEIKRRAEEKNHKFIRSLYDKSQTRAVLQCGNCGNEYIAYVSSISDRCKNCVELRSKAEIELHNMIDNLLFGVPDIKVIPNDRDFLISTGLTNRRLEIDIMIYKNDAPILAIEWNGIYWHSLEEAKEKDAIKLNIFKQINVPFIQVTDDSINSNDLMNSVFQDSKNILRKHICV